MSYSEGSATYDFIVIGGGTNGLTAASYLCKQGQRVLLVERQSYLGGGAITQDLTLQGFHHDVFATSINSWRTGPVQQDLELEKYGYHDINPDPVAATPFKSGKTLAIYRDLSKTLKSITQFSQSDADKYKKNYRFYLESKEILHTAIFSPPLSFSAMMSALEESDTGLDFLQFSYMSVRDWLEEEFESEEMRAFMTLWTSNHSPLSPEEPRGALIALGFVGALQDVGIGVPVGGMQTLTNSFRRYIESHDGTILTSAEVVEILIHDQRVIGVKCEDGRSFHSRNGIIANVEPRSLFLKLVPEKYLTKEFRKKAKDFRFSKVSEVMIHAALDTWFDYRPRELQRTGLVQIGETLDEISRAYNDCVVGRLPENPFMTIANTTFYDSTRAPKGKHIMWNFARAPTLINGRHWTDNEKEKFADICMSRLADYAPNASKIVLKRVVLSPQDIERINPNMINGDSGGGKPTLDQSLALRPFPGWAQYKTPIKGLYICGPGTHPGGGVNGASGHNAVQVALLDADL